MSQAELARRLNISSTTLNGYVLGKYRPKYERLDKIAAALGVTSDYLLGKDAACVLSEEEMTLVLRYRQLDEQRKGMVNEYLAFLDSRE